MPIIKSISDLRNKSNEISDLAHNSQEPIYITRNGEGDLVVMSVAAYSRMQLQVELAGKLAEAQASYSSGDRGRSLNDVVRNLKEHIRDARS